MKSSQPGSSNVVERARAASILTLLSLSIVASACTPAPVSRAEEHDEEALAAHELERLPKEGVATTLIDFGGKVHLVGYELEPSQVVHPGGSLKIRLYWRAVAPLQPGFRLATYVISGSRVDTFESGGPLRQDQKLGPSAWRTGKLYADEQQIQIPSDIQAKEVTIAVGVVRDALPKPEAKEPEEAAKKEGEAEAPADVTHPPLRLPVLSGPSDGRERAILAHLRNDVSAKVAPRARRVPNDPSRRPIRAASSAR